MKQDNLHQESPFERYISKKIADLTADGKGWVVSPDDTGFDASTALYMPDFIAYLEATAPEKIDKMKSNLRANWETNLRLALVKALENEGTVKVLREGFQMAGYSTITCSGHYPDDPRLPKQKLFYDENILRVMHQVHYQTAGNKSLDLVFFINGIPVATAEIKTELTQTVYDAIEEYQTQRKPIEPMTNRKNYLLFYKRGAVVHFAISESEIWMCTDLSGDKPKFLPFNKGNNGHAGNVPMQPGDTEYPTGYFWNDICQKENWLRIFHNFIYEEEKQEEDATGRLRTVKRQIFPRFHQWDCVTKSTADIWTLGVGQKYLIEHSAGSGKTSTISWIAHELIRMREPDGERKFSSVIVVTNRVSLDTNIDGTIQQLKKTVGLIAHIGFDEGGKRTGTSKSKQLAEAIKNKTEIIVVTLQTFPFALDEIAKAKELTGAKFAVLIDEAHGAAEGVYNNEMNAALKLASKAKQKEADAAHSDVSDITGEDLIDQYFLAKQEARTMPDNVSFFAFTATPKAETKTIFGRPGPNVDKNGNPLPESFHLYPMRQAIEEGYIIDVLTGYLPYQTAYRMKEDIVKDQMVDARKALKTIAHWQSLHATNVTQKAEFIVEHFVKNVASLLEGQAKAMIVTPFRSSVIRYKAAIDAYLKKHPEYDRSKIAEHLQFKVPGEPLVAFSGKIMGEKCIMPEDAELVENPFTVIQSEFEYTEDNINNLGYETIEQAFNRPANRLLIVANKFQTGFDQPKLCAMYIDKKIANDIEIVQTYSRVNRRYSGKEKVFIVDFVNDPETVTRAFQKYDKGARMEKAQSLDIIYDIKKALDGAMIYTSAEFDEFKKVRYQSLAKLSDNKDISRKSLYQAVSAPAERWLAANKAQNTALTTWRDIMDEAMVKKDEMTVKQANAKIQEIQEEVDKLADFRKKLKRFCDAYDYISQVIFLEDPDLEVFYAFAKLLYHRTQGTSLDEIDVKNLVLTDYRINEIQVSRGGDDAVLRPMGAGGKGHSQKKRQLREIITKINSIWGEDANTVTGARTINAIADYVSGDDVSRVQIQNSTNSKDSVIADGRLESIIKLAAVSLMNNEFAQLAATIVDDPQAWRPLAEVIYDLVDKRKRLDIPDIMEALQEINSEKAR